MNDSKWASLTISVFMARIFFLVLITLVCKTWPWPAWPGGTCHHHYAKLDFPERSPTPTPKNIAIEVALAGYSYNKQYQICGQENLVINFLLIHDNWSKSWLCVCFCRDSFCYFSSFRFINISRCVLKSRLFFPSVKCSSFWEVLLILEWAGCTNYLQQLGNYLCVWFLSANLQLGHKWNWQSVPKDSLIEGTAAEVPVFLTYPLLCLGDDDKIVISTPAYSRTMQWDLLTKISSQQRKHQFLWHYRQKWGPPVMLVPE